MTNSDVSPEIAEKIINVVIFEGLELEEIGIARDDIGLDTLLFDESGLGLDSVDGLEIIAGVQREFSVSFAGVDDDVIAKNSATVRQLTAMVEEHLGK